MVVNDSAWVIVGYPRFAPQIVNMVTLNEVVEDLAIRQFAFRPEMYGVLPFESTKPPPQTDDAWRVWREQRGGTPIIIPTSPATSGPSSPGPSNTPSSWTSTRSPAVTRTTTPRAIRGTSTPISSASPRITGKDPVQEQQFRDRRMFLFEVLRRPGEENQFTRPLSPGQSYSVPGSHNHRKESTHSARLTGDLQNRLIAMPYLCGDNPLSNSVVSKFLRLTDMMLFLLGQWAAGKFINETREDIPTVPDRDRHEDRPPARPGRLEQCVGGRSSARGAR